VNQKGQRTKAKLDTELASRFCSVAGKLRVVSGKTEIAIVTADATNRCGPNPDRSAPPTVLLVVICQQHLIVLQYCCPEVDRTMSLESSWYVGTRCTIRVCTLRPATLSHSNPSHTSILLYFECPPRCAKVGVCRELGVSLYGNRVDSGAWLVRIGET
jgi:hypothetical protein